MAKFMVPVITQDGDVKLVDIDKGQQVESFAHKHVEQHPHLSAIASRAVWRGVVADATKFGASSRDLAHEPVARREAAKAHKEVMATKNVPHHYTKDEWSNLKQFAHHANIQADGPSDAKYNKYMGHAKSFYNSYTKRTRKNKGGI